MSKQNIRFLIVRHGESEANIDRSIYMRKPDVLINLTERGHNQAVNAGVFLEKFLSENQRGNRICLFTSPYRRARQTAYEIFCKISASSHLKVKEYDWLSEQSFGVAQGENENKDAWMQKYPDHAYFAKQAREHNIKHWAIKPEGERRADVGFRVKMAIDSAFRENEQNGTDTFIIVCHSVTMRQLAKTLLNLPYEVADCFEDPDNCDVWLIQRPGPTEKFADFGMIWKSGQAQEPRQVYHKTTQECFATGAYAWKPTL